MMIRTEENCRDAAHDTLDVLKVPPIENLPAIAVECSATPPCRAPITATTSTTRKGESENGSSSYRRKILSSPSPTSSKRRSRRRGQGEDVDGPVAGAGCDDGNTTGGVRRACTASWSACPLFDCASQNMEKFSPDCLGLPVLCSIHAWALSWLA